MNYGAEKRFQTEERAHMGKGSESGRTWPVEKLKAVPYSWRVKRMRGLGEWLLGNQGEDFSFSPKGQWETEEGLEEGVNMSQDQICLETTRRV